jgi:aspartyl-tRNA synthetase
MNRTLIKDLKENIGKKVAIKGWVDIRRDHGKLIFLDLRDFSGKVQAVSTPKIDDHSVAETLRPEWVVEVKGTVKERPENMVNKDQLNGSVELIIGGIRVLSQAKTSPIPIETEGYDIDEEVRNKYRYLDLRRQRMQKNIKLRHRTTSLVREFFDKEGFVEIETPTLTKTSPEGARDFLVPSRMQPGKFYALPQAPQQYKQLLMIAGFEKYYQIAHALRDEDLRKDRQLEHTQIDVEMSFVTEEELRTKVEEMFVYVAENMGYKITKKPFPVLTHEEAIEEHGADKFDLRENKEDNKELAFAWVTNFPLFEKNEETGKLTFAHNPFSKPKEEHVEKLMKGDDLENLRAQQYDLVLNGYELASGGVRISDPKVQAKVFEIMGLSKEQIKERFRHILEAYEYGAPPHAGIAAGLDRFVMILAGEQSIRETIAFPVSSGGQTSVMDAPSEIPKAQLNELGIEVKKGPKK